MATQEKLLKSLEFLKSIGNSTASSEMFTRKKEKIQHCYSVTEIMSNSAIRIAPNFGQLLSYSIEVLLQLCDDNESDIRLVADECLNRLIRAMSDGNLSKVQIELHKEIKKNGSSRSLRAALWRFSELAHQIRPYKGKPYVANLMPCISKITERTEEMIHETLANSLPKIMASLGCFTTDNDIKALMKACLSNVSSNSAVIRRTSASCILTLCLNCRKPYVFITYILNCLLDMLIPVQDTHTSSLILGIMGCLKVILPHIKNCDYDQEEIKDSFGVRREVNEAPLAVDRVLQVYELCLHYILDSDHNIVNASLECLNSLLQNLPNDLKLVLLSINGINKRRINLSDSNSKLKHRSPSQLSIATSISGEDNLLESELMDSLRPDIEKWIDESKLSVLNLNYGKTYGYLNKPSVVHGSDELATPENIQQFNYSNISIGTVTDETDATIKCDKSISDNLDKLILSETSSERSFVQLPVESGIVPSDGDVNYQDVNVGDFCDKDIPLKYCARLIIKLFLLTGHPRTLIPDKTVRVSVKSLSLTCLSSIFQLYPQIFLQYLDCSCIDTAASNIRQPISDILLFKNHSDPQLRGTVRILIGNYIKAVLVQSSGSYQAWLSENNFVNDDDTFDMKNLIDIILTGLEDESSNCSKQSLLCLCKCLKQILESKSSVTAIPILNILPLIAKNPYWLVKATLLEVISDMQYITVNHVHTTSEFQDKVIHNILFELLKDENQRVRTACSNAIVQIIPWLYFKQDSPNDSTVTQKASYYKTLYLSNLILPEPDTNLNRKQLLKNMPFPLCVIGKNNLENVNQSLSRIVSKLWEFLLTSTTKSLIHGCIETLCLLSYKYPPTIYPNAWGSFTTFNITVEQKSFASSTTDITFGSSKGLFNICMGLLCNATIAYDLNCHLRLLKLCSNLVAGIAVQNLKAKTDITLDESAHLWNMFMDKNLQLLSEQFLVHVLKLLNIFCHVIEETVPALPQSKPLLPNLPTPSTLSPIKRRRSDVTDKTKAFSPSGKIPEKDEKGEKKPESIKSNYMGYFGNSPHYLKLYELLRTAYTNYKTTLDFETSEKFLELLRTTLHTLSLLLEFATLTESGRISEEILSYCSCTFILESASTVECVQQLLKSLFGTNLTCCVSDITLTSSSTKTFEEKKPNSFYYHIWQKPYDETSLCINSFRNLNKIDRNGDNVIMGYLHHRINKKTAVLPRGTEKILANYIRLFEPMVIKSLKQYTITSDTKMQCKVLQLLCQLVQLKVNYCLLDSDQIFIGFVLKQFEYIEEGQILLSSELVPQIFNFLVHLSYGKQHSKSVISVPKIIQLCDGLMASGQPPLSHCIPALEPVIEDIFLCRNKSSTSDFTELETTREVLLSMLLRLLEYPPVIELLAFVLNESKYCNDNSDKWLKWSKQVADVFLPMLKQNKIIMNNSIALVSIRKLIFVLNPSVFKPLNEVLLMLFDEPPHEGCLLSQVNRWLGKILVLLLIILQVKEEFLLVQIMEVQSDFVPQSVFRNIITIADPLNVTNTSEYFNDINPEVIFIRYIFRIMDIVMKRCMDIVNPEEEIFLIELFSSFLMFCLHLLQSGSHCKIANTAMKLVRNEFNSDENDEELPLEDINSIILKLSSKLPSITFKWCYFLSLLNYNNRRFWSRVMQITESYGIVNNLQDVCIIQNPQCINLEIVRIGGTIVFCDYLNENMADGEQISWFVVNNIELLVRLSNEEPVQEFLSSLHRTSPTSGLVIQAITTKCLPIVQANFRTKILKCVENVHSSQIGPVLRLLLPRILDSRHLALSRLVANLASRKIELLLTMSMEDVTNQLPKDDLIHIMDLLVERKLVKKHEALVSLLNKLATQYYDLSPLEFDQRRTVNPDYIKKLQINKMWYTSQVKSKCCIQGIVPEASELLSYLDYGDLLNIMYNKDFNKLILRDCIVLSTNKIKEDHLPEEPDLLKASIHIILRNIIDMKSFLPKSHQVYKVIGRIESSAEMKYSHRLSEQFSDSLFWNFVYQIIPAVTIYMQSLPSLPNHIIPDNNLEELIKFSVVCLESLNYIIQVDRTHLNIDCIDMALDCANAVLRCNNVYNILSHNNYNSWLCSAVNSIYKLVFHLLLGSEPMPDVQKYGLSNFTDNLEVISASHACHQLLILTSWLEKHQCSVINIPKCLTLSIKGIIASLSRLPVANSYLLTPPSAWKNGLTTELSGSFNTQIPSLPIEFLQEVDILEEFIFRITLLGWTNRQQFEETWVCLLSVLSSSVTEDSSPEEINAVVHVTSLAVQAITSLLLQTLLSPVIGNGNVSRLLHVSRDLEIEDKPISVRKLKNVHNKLQNKHNEHTKLLKTNNNLTSVFHNSNLEKLTDEYSFGQLSVEYLLISAKSVEIVDDDRVAAQVFNQRQKLLNESGLDLNSCLQFLIDLYTQWIKALFETLEELKNQPTSSSMLYSDKFTKLHRVQRKRIKLTQNVVYWPAQNTPLRILYEVVRSILVISDLFTEKSQFTWMLDVCLDLSKTHTIEDEIMQQYIVICVCKAVAVLTPDLEIYETVKKLIIQNLKSGFIPSKIAGLHGILYIVQGGFLGNTRIGGLSEEMQLIFPVAIDYINQNLNNETLNQSPDHSLLLWATAFYLIENIEDNHFTSDFSTTVTLASVTYISQQKIIAVQNAILKGLERLVIKQKLPRKTQDQLIKLSLEKMRNCHTSVALPAVQILLSCIYTDYAEQLESCDSSSGWVQSNPDTLVQRFEKISAIFDRIKRGYPFEVEILCTILPDILNDFFPPSDILTKVLGEFLSPQQPHTKLLSRVVFKVFQCAIQQSQLSLLQDWVVFSLSNFTQSFSIGMATWCLTCFFVSASSNEWLRSLFPYIQSRVGRYEYEDRKMLCITGADFYKNLNNDKQKETFIKTFTKVKDNTDTPFLDLLASL